MNCLSFISGQDCEQLIDRFIRYCKIDTHSDSHSSSFPSTQIQFNLAKILVEELKNIGVESVLSEYCYVYVTLPENRPTKTVLGLVTHLDTSPMESSENVQPIIHKAIDGNDLHLPKDDTVISKNDLEFYKGQDIITTDGSTLLGGDDKAGVAAVMQLITVLQREKEKIPHGQLKFVFTPDEEISGGTKKIDLSVFNPQVAYTLDSTRIGSIHTETFNAKEAVFDIVGKEIHPGRAYNVMVNASKVVAAVVAMLPLNEAPETTADTAGYFHPVQSEAKVGRGYVRIIVRDFTDEGIAKREATLHAIHQRVQHDFEGAQISLTIKPQYENMGKILNQPSAMYLLDNALECFKALNISPIHTPFRGGTDGAALCFRGIPTPNLFTGGENFHGKTEFVPIPSLYQLLRLLVLLIQKF